MPITPRPTDQLPLADLVLELRSLCQQGANGTAFITTDSRAIAQVCLEDGQIVFVLFQNKRGAEALELMKQIKSGRLRFEEGSIPSFRTPLPTWEIVLSDLIGGVPAADAPLSRRPDPISKRPDPISKRPDPISKRPDPISRRPDPVSQRPDPKDDMPLNKGLGPFQARVRAILEATLMEYIGPMASLVCDEKLPKATDLESAIEILATEIPDAEQAVRFMHEVYKRLA